jgi:oxygen-dependent protoporphyrinogen oxidase
MTERQVTVVGGGIAGLAAAYRAAKISREHGLNWQVALLEKADYWGGKITTERTSGFVIEGGPDTFIVTKPWAMQICRELGISGRLQGTNPDKNSTYVLKDQELTPLPEGLMMMIPSKFKPMIFTELLTWPEKARMGLDFLIPPRQENGDESLGHFVTRRLGRAAYERLIEPLMSGIYAGDGDQLSLQSTFPYLHDLEQKHGGLIKGALAVRKKRESRRKNGSSTSGKGIFRTPQTGLAELVEAYLEAMRDLGVELALETGVASVDRLEAGYRLNLEGGEKRTCDAVILAAPAYVSGELVQGLDQQLADQLKAIPYVSTATVSWAFPEADLSFELDGRGYVIPRREGREALACTWTSSKFPHRAPDGHALLRVFVGRAGQEEALDWTEEELLAVARRELKETLGIEIEPSFTRVHIWEKAMPQYNLGHPDRLEVIDQALENYPGLEVAGNGYRGIGIPDCIHSGEQAVERIRLSWEGQPTELSEPEKAKEGMR